MIPSDELNFLTNFDQKFKYILSGLPLKDYNDHNYSKKVTHGEAVLAGMIFASKLSLAKKVCNIKTINEIKKIYNENNLNYTYKKFSNKNSIINLIPFLKNDKKNNDDKINFILLKEIGKTALPNKYKISLNNLKKMSKSIAQY